MKFKQFKKTQENLKESIKKINAKKKDYSDERIWNLTKDTAGNSQAIIRFLPQQNTEKTPMVSTFRHAFNEQGRWFIEECPVTIDEKCPVCEHSSSIWSSNEKEARKFWRTKGYISNILVQKDEMESENEGKVFLFKYGKKIYDMLMDRIYPEDGEEGSNIFNFDKGLDFKLKLSQVGGFNNYDRSSFVFKSTSLGNESEQEKIFNSIYDLDEFIDPKRFKTYDELVKKLANFVTSDNVTPLSQEIAEKIKKKAKVEDVPEDDTDDEDIDFESLLSD